MRQLLTSPACQALVAQVDPMDIGANVDLDNQCATAYSFCLQTVQAPYVLVSGVSEDSPLFKDTS